MRKLQMRRILKASGYYVLMFAIPVVLFTVMLIIFPEIGLKNIPSLFKQALFPTVLSCGLMFNFASGNWDLAIGAESVLAAILAGRLGGFGADVYSTEPFGAEHPFSALLGMPQVCLTPHMSWGALEARERCLREMILNMQAFFRGELRNRVDC